MHFYLFRELSPDAVPVDVTAAQFKSTILAALKEVFGDVSFSNG